jgi:hypothetical protein
MVPLPRFTFGWDEGGCPICKHPLLLKSTKPRKILSLTYGEFIAIERCGYCPRHVEASYVRSARLQRIVAPGANVAYDVLVSIGMARFLECRQCQEIARELSRHHGIDVPPRTVSYLAQKFVAYVEVVHQDSVDLLRKDMRRRGGYILHVDGTCEEGSRVLFVCLDSLSGQVLESRKISSENSDEVRNVLQDVRRDWGTPLAAVHDLRQALIIATGEVFPKTPQFLCHYHLAADVGKDILSSHVDKLRRLFRRTKIRPKLRALVRSLKDFAVSKESSEHIIAPVLGLRSRGKLRQYCTPEAAKGAAHALASWILAFSHSGEGYGFPFDMPYLALYQRIRDVHQVLSEAGNRWPKGTRGPLASLNRLREILDIVVTGEYADEFHEIVNETKRDQKVFESFRAVLRICPKGGKQRRNDGGAPTTLSRKRHEASLRKLRASLQRRARSGSPSGPACKIVVDHLDKYWSLLFGHVLRQRSRKKITVPRTNNVEERLFGIVKRQCRRLHGRGHLSHDIDTMLPAVPLVLNLNNRSYCETVYGGQEPAKIAARFSAVSSDLPAQLITTWKREKLSMKIPRKLEGLQNLPQELAKFIAVALHEFSS